jgi:DnaA family protein
MIDQLTLSLRLHDEARFENFYVGENHELCIFLKKMLVSAQNELVYIWGNSGVGKSHLLQASCQLVGQHHLAAIYLPLNNLHEISPQVLEGVEDFYLVCIDNIEKMAGLREWEEAVFHFYNRARENGLHLLVAGRALPRELSFLLPDLSSRLAAGVTYYVKPLTDSQKLAALQVRAQERGLVLSREVGNYLLNHYPRDMHALFKVLEILDQASFEAQRRLTIPFVKTVLCRG